MSGFGRLRLLRSRNCRASRKACSSVVRRTSRVARCPFLVTWSRPAGSPTLHPQGRIPQRTQPEYDTYSRSAVSEHERERELRERRSDLSQVNTQTLLFVIEVGDESDLQQGDQAGSLDCRSWECHKREELRNSKQEGTSAVLRTWRSIGTCRGECFHASASFCLHEQLIPECSVAR